MRSRLLRTLLSITALAAIGHSLAAQTSRWEPATALDGGYVVSLGVAGDGTLFVGSLSRGMFRSTDGGESWHRLTLPGDPTRVGQIFVVGAEIVASTANGVLRSTDRGASWTGGGASISPIGFDPTSRQLFRDTANAIYRSDDLGQSWVLSGPKPHAGYTNAFGVSQVSGALLTASHTAIYRSTDDGATWDTVLPRLEGPSSLSIRNFHAGPEGALYATGFSMGLLRSTDDGITWEAIGAGLELPAESGQELTFAIGPAGSMVGALGPKGTLYASGDDGETWQPTGASVGVGVRAIVIGADGTIWLGVDESGVFRSIDGGRSVTAASNGLSASGFATQMAASQGYVYAANGSLLVRSSDDGTTWEPLGRAGTLNTTALAVGPDGEIVIGGGGIGVSRDGGSTWWFSSTRLPSPGAQNIQSLAFSNGALYIGTANGLFSMRLPDTTVFGPAFGGLVIPALTALSDGSVLGAAAVQDGRLHRTVDGNEWTPIDFATSTGRLLGNVRDIATDGRGNVVITTASGVFSSSDNGTAWRADTVAEREYETVLGKLLFVEQGPVFAMSGATLFSRQPGDTVWRREELTLSDPITSMTADSNGRVYLGLLNGNVIRSTGSLSSAPAPHTERTSSVTIRSSVRDGVIAVELAAERALSGSLELIDLAGRTHVTIDALELHAGTTHLELPAEGLATGAYLLRLRAGADAAVVPIVVE